MHSCLPLLRLNPTVLVPLQPVVRKIYVIISLTITLQESSYVFPLSPSLASLLSKKRMKVFTRYYLHKMKQAWWAKQRRYLYTAKGIHKCSCTRQKQNKKPFGYSTPRFRSNKTLFLFSREQERNKRRRDPFRIEGEHLTKLNLFTIVFKCWAVFYMMPLVLCEYLGAHGIILNLCLQTFSKFVCLFCVCMHVVYTNTLRKDSHRKDFISSAQFNQFYDTHVFTPTCTRMFVSEYLGHVLLSGLLENKEENKVLVPFTRIDLSFSSPFTTTISMLFKKERGSMAGRWEKRRVWFTRSQQVWLKLEREWLSCMKKCY